MDWRPFSKYARYALTMRRERSQPTLHCDEVSQIMRNPYIYTGYRRCYENRKYYIDSLFQIHNETLNVWTHFVATFVLIYKFAQTAQYVRYFEDPNSLAVFVFSIGAIQCSALSALAHLMHSRSEYHHFKYFQIDYAGVNLNGQAIGMIYFFFCGTENFYRTWGTWFVPYCHVIICLMSVILKGCAKTFCKHGSKWSALTNLFCTALSCTWSGLPLWYQVSDVLSRGDMDAFWNDCFLPITHYILLTSAGFFYGAKIPECFFPGKFDIVGHAHQIMHVLVTSMSLAQFTTIADLYPKRSPELTALANPTIWNTLVPHLCVLIPSFVFIFVTTQMTKARAKQQFEIFKEEKKNKTK